MFDCFRITGAEVLFGAAPAGSPTIPPVLGGGPALVVPPAGVFRNSYHRIPTVLPLLTEWFATRDS